MPAAPETGPAPTRIVEHEAGDVGWRVVQREPHGSLGDHVASFNAYHERGTGHLVRRELPSGLATMVFNLGADLGVAFPGEASETFGAGGAFFSGPGSRYATTETRAGQDGAQVMLTALGARRLLGVPLGDVGDRLIDPIDLFGPEARELRERLQEANGEERRIAILAEAVTRRLREASDLPADLVFAMRRLTQTRGRIGIAALAAELECSRRHLGRRFTREFGLAPKLFARLLRFDRAVRALEADRVASLAELAVACGYADQSHLSRDFAEFAGDPPATFASRRLPEGGFGD